MEKTLRVFLEDIGKTVTLSLTPEMYARAENDMEFLRSLIYGNEESIETSNNTESSNNVPVPEMSQSTQDSLSVNADGINDTNFIWRNEGVLLLLSLYEEIKEQFTTRRHKGVWADIANKMKLSGFQVTPGQCQTKINGLKRTYKKIKDHNNKSGNERVTWPFLERMTEIFGQTAWVQPLALASELGPFNSPEASPSGSQSPNLPSPSPSHSQHKKRRLDYRKEREENKRARFEQLIKLKEKQHKEKIELIKLLLSRNSP